MAYVCVKYSPWKIINVNKHSFLYQSPIIYSWGTSLSYAPISYLWTIIHLALFKWPQIWHKVHNNHTSNDVLISSSPATYLVWNFKKVHAKKLKFTVTLREEIDRASTKIPFIIMRAKHMMVWWYKFDHKTPFDHLT